MSKNCYFKDSSIWSYGSHYELGRFIEYKGVRVVMINNSGYSQTTSKHISSAWDAVKGQNRLLSKTGLGTDQIGPALLAWQKRLIDSIMGILSQRKIWDVESALNPYGLEEFNRTTAHLGFAHLQINLPEHFKQVLRDHIKYREQRDTELNAARAVELQAKADLNREKDLKSLALWKAGGEYRQAFRLFNPQHVRVIGEVIETTRGAEVPLQRARMLLLCLDNDVNLRGKRIGHFTIDKIEGDLITIGCHTLSLKQVREAINNK